MNITNNKEKSSLSLIFKPAAYCFYLTALPFF